MFIHLVALLIPSWLPPLTLHYLQVLSGWRHKLLSALNMDVCVCACERGRWLGKEKKTFISLLSTYFLALKTAEFVLYSGNSKDPFLKS